MRVVGALVLSLPVWSQMPEGLKPDFFKQEPRVLMVAAADKARVQREPDGRLLAEAGRVYLAAGDRERAEDAFKRAVQVAPKDPGTFYAISVAWLRHGQVDKAKGVLDQMPTSSARAAEWLAKAGLRFLEAKAPKIAEGAMEQAYGYSPKDWELCLEFGRAWVKAQQLEQAARWFQRAVALRPKDEETWIAIAAAYADYWEGSACPAR